MGKKIFLPVIFFFLFFYIFSMPIIRYPAPSPDGMWIAFTYQGDIWKAKIDGTFPMRLTDSESYDAYPVWSTDGEKIAFSSKRNGNFDVFVMDSDGRNLKQITFFSRNDYVLDWDSSGNIFFSSQREFTKYYGSINIYRVSSKGGTPKRVLKNDTSYGKISPDGRYLLYVKGRFPWWRLHYKGSANFEIYLYDFKRKEHIRMTDYRGNDNWPIWSPDSKSFYFVSERDGSINLYKMDLNTKEIKRITNFKDLRITFPSSSRNKNLLAFERMGKVYILEKENELRELKLTLPEDLKRNSIEKLRKSSDVSEIAVSPDGKMVAFVVRGDIFVLRRDIKNFKKAKNITNSWWREKNISFSPDGKKILFISDENGNDDIFTIESEDGKSFYASLKYKITPILKTPEDELFPKYSPDGSKIAFLKASGNLYTMESSGENVKLIYKCWNQPDYSWSPDGKWIAFSKYDGDYNADIFIMPSGGGNAINITEHPDNDIHPIWSRDGKFIVFSSKRNADYKEDNVDVYMVYLTKRDSERSKEEWEELWVEKKSVKKEEDKKEKKKVEVKIDFEDISFRVKRITKLTGTQIALATSPDSREILFLSDHTGKTLLYKIDIFGKNLKKVSNSELLDFDSEESIPNVAIWNSKNKNIYFISKGGFIKKVSGNKEKSIPFLAKLVINHKLERRQKFLESWRLINDYFYDPNFHGYDWKSFRNRYLPLAESCDTIEDFDDVVDMMLGEINASHMGIYYLKRPKGAVHTGFLGILPDENYSGMGIKILDVLKNTPAYRDESRLYPGDIILSVDGKEIKPDVNFYSLFEDKVGEKVYIKVKGKDGNLRNVIITPTGFMTVRQAYYEKWVSDRRELVHKLSNGRIGYIHIQSMGQPSLERFEMLLYKEAHDKDGLIIDVRNNGGGWTTDYILAMLMVRNHAYTKGRGSWETGYPQDRRPLYAFTKPIVAMCNENSYSNAEIFSWAIKTLKRGPLVGNQTFGAVISTGGAYLIDGSLLRLPGRGWYVEGSGINMELHGCMPDYLVELAPSDEENDRDPQLIKAVEVLLKNLRNKN